MKKINVLLADDHSVVREGLRMLLELEGGFTVVGEAANGRDAVALTQILHPDVVVLDIAMPQLNGLEAARQILSDPAPVPRVIMLSAHGDDAYVEQVAALGVAGYLVKQTSAQLLATAIREIVKGNLYYSPSIDGRLQELQETATLTQPQFSRAGRPRKKVEHLTAREREVLQLVAEGYANKQIAAELGISIKTIEKHRQSVMRKLDIHDTAGLTRYAISAGIIENSVQKTIT